ncbi:MAG: response regulator [Lachnospiraceae bacterium]|jgi:two-component system response regulator YcbB|nr:response regulator [Lachnospiraceae bacterium]
MNFYLIDDDRNIINILSMIITHENLGKVSNSNTNPVESLDDIKDVNPDIVIVDLLMPELDGISFVKEAKKILDDVAFVMLSQVSSKDMISDAYEAGIDFFIQKPLNGIEVKSVLNKVIHSLEDRRTVRKMQSLFIGEGVEAKNPPVSKNQSVLDSQIEHLKGILQQLGIIGELGSSDIITLIEYLLTNKEEINSFTLHNLCAKFSDSPKSMEQRIRRASYSALLNLANLGIEDYGNEIFCDYSNTLFNFEQVRREMDYIRGKSSHGGNVKIKSFLIALLNDCQR